MIPCRTWLKSALLAPLLPRLSSQQTSLQSPVKAPRLKPGDTISHITDKFTIPVGLNAEIDATKGTIQLLESAVS